MKSAIDAYLAELWRSEAVDRAVVAAAEVVAGDPWAVVAEAGLLARCSTVVAERDLGLRADLRAVAVDSPKAVVRIPQGARYPAPQNAGRSQRGGFDTPQPLARRLVAQCIAAFGAVPKSALDPSCGMGAFLLALHEAGVAAILGTDVDPLAVLVAKLAVPSATIELRDGLAPGPEVELVVGNPPFVPSERQDKEYKSGLLRRFPWLKGRFDLSVPFAAAALERVGPGGIVGLVLPAPILMQPYGEPLRRLWLSEHRIVDFSATEPFVGASVDVVTVIVQRNAPTTPLPAHGIAASQVLEMEGAILRRDLLPIDREILRRMASADRFLRDLCKVDTGVVVHGPMGGRDRLLSDEPGDGRVPYADAADFFSHRNRWLDYRPELMHRAKHREMFELPKIVVQRLRGAGPVRAEIDRTGIFVGHTCTIVQPKPGCPFELEFLLGVLKHPLLDGWIRLTRGERLDLYPRDVGSIPIPRMWDVHPELSLQQALGLDDEMTSRLLSLSSEGSSAPA